MIEVGHPTQTSPFSSESLVPVALVLPVIVRFRMRFLVPVGAAARPVNRRAADR